jgi:hypothetical protein
MLPHGARQGLGVHLDTLDKGQITVEGPFNDTGDSLFAITGGTGDFAAAQGEMVLSAYRTKGDAYTFIYKLK